MLVVFLCLRPLILHVVVIHLLNAFDVYKLVHAKLSGCDYNHRTLMEVENHAKEHVASGSVLMSMHMLFRNTIIMFSYTDHTGGTPTARPAMLKCIVIGACICGCTAASECVYLCFPGFLRKRIVHACILCLDPTLPVCKGADCV